MQQPVKRTTENRQELTENTQHEVSRIYSLNKNAGRNTKGCISEAKRPEVLTAQTKAARAHANPHKPNKNTQEGAPRAHSFNKITGGNTKKCILGAKRPDVLIAIKLDLSLVKAQTKSARVHNFARLFDPMAIYYQDNNVVALLDLPHGNDMNNKCKFCSLPTQLNDIPPLPLDNCFLIRRDKILLKTTETHALFKEIDDMLARMNVVTVKYNELPKRSQQDVSLARCKCKKRILPAAKKKPIFFSEDNQETTKSFPYGEEYTFPETDNGSLGQEERIFNQQPSDAFEIDVEGSTTTHQQQSFVPRDNARNVEEPYREVIMK